MKSQTYGTGIPGTLERILNTRTPQSVWLYRVESLYLMTTAMVLTAEQRAYLSHYYDEQVKCGYQPMIATAVAILIRGMPDFEYVTKGH